MYRLIRLLSTIETNAIMQFSGQAKHDKQLYIVLIKATRVSTVFHMTSNSSAYRNDFHILALVDSSLSEFIKNQHNDQLSVVSQRSWVQIPYRRDIFLLPIFTNAHVVFIMRRSLSYSLSIQLIKPNYNL